MRDPIYITGPTASGKSELALLLAERLDGEIISVDSMQVYQGLDIGTAKPSLEERKHVPHHLIDVLPLTAQFDAAQFLRLAKAAEEDVRSRGKTVVYCGGTGLYFKALASGIGAAPPSDPQLRRSLEDEPIEKLLAEIKENDPATFENIDPNNPRRVIRAVEVLRLTGKPFSLLRESWESPQPSGLWIGLNRERTDLIRRINARVDKMFAQGLIEETRRLLERGLEQNRTAMQALGYRQVVEHLRGEQDLAATIALIKQKTRQFAKRQMTWFRGQLDLLWIDVRPGSTTADLAQNVLNLE